MPSPELREQTYVDGHVDLTGVKPHQIDAIRTALIAHLAKAPHTFMRWVEAGVRMQVVRVDGTHKLENRCVSYAINEIRGGMAAQFDGLYNIDGAWHVCCLPNTCLDMGEAED